MLYQQYLNSVLYVDYYIIILELIFQLQHFQQFYVMQYLQFQLHLGEQNLERI